MSARLKQIFSDNSLKAKNDSSEHENTNKSYTEDGMNRDRGYLVSRSGRFKHNNKKREPLDTKLFSKESNTQNESHSETSEIQTAGTTISKKSFQDIEAWIENSFKSTFDEYKTIKPPKAKKSHAPPPPGTIEKDGAYETAF